jgi:hypothetical protein
MEEILLFVEEQQTWIYLLLAIAGLIYLSSIFRAYRELQRAVFALERERAMSMLIRSGAMMALVIAALAATFVVATFAGPALPLSTRQTPLPTVSLLDTPETGEEALAEDFATATPFDPMSVNNTGCQNPDATIASPKDGDSVSGVVDVLGTANIANFAFYKLEYRKLSPDAEWIPVSAGTQPVCELCDTTEELGTWNTSLVIPGDYAFRLVVTDTAGNAPLPCEIRLRVLPSP